MPKGKPKIRPSNPERSEGRFSRLGRSGGGSYAEQLRVEDVRARHERRHMLSAGGGYRAARAKRQKAAHKELARKTGRKMSTPRGIVKDLAKERGIIPMSLSESRRQAVVSEFMQHCK